jgi:5-amino-6-(5-phosphoribosylamino)uracil reductase
MTADRRAALADRPYVTMNVAESADGKLAPVGGGKVNFGSLEDRALMEALRSEADGVLIGGGTLRTEDPPLIIRDPEVRRNRVADKGSPHPRNITVCSVLPERLADMRFFRAPETEKVVFTTARTPPALRDAAAQYARVEVVPADSEGRVDLVEVLRRLLLLGVRSLLLEGGGELNFSMLQAGLIDELYVTVCPFVFGGRTAPTSFDGAGFTRDQIRRLALKGHRFSSTGEVFLRYEVVVDTPPLVYASELFPDGFEIR